MNKFERNDAKQISSEKRAIPHVTINNKDLQPIATPRTSFPKNFQVARMFYIIDYTVYLNYPWQIMTSSKDNRNWMVADACSQFTENALQAAIKTKRAGAQHSTLLFCDGLKEQG